MSSELKREDSLDLEERSGTVPSSKEGDEPSEEPPLSTSNTSDYQDEDLNIPPGRMNACRVKRLSGSGSSSSLNASLQQAQQQVQQPLKTSRDGVRSRSRSPSINTRDRTTVPSATQTTTDANSSISSFEDILVDQDILYDRQGLVELDLSESQRRLQHSREFGVNLPSVNERLSEETLDDVHAFSDVVRSSNASRVSAGTGTEAMLEPLNECGEEDEDLDAIDEEGT